MERVNGYILGVSQLNEYVNNLLRRDGLLQGLQVRERSAALSGIAPATCIFP